MLSLVIAALMHQAPTTHELPCDGFALAFTSASGAPTEDDERVEVVTAAGRFTVPLAPALFTGIGAPRAMPLSKTVRCREGLVAYEVSKGLVALALSRSGRPGLDFLSLALIDLEHRKALGVIDTTFEIASGRVESKAGVQFSLLTREAKGGFDVRVVREWVATGDDSATGAAEDWLAVRVVKRQLSAKWLRR